MAASATYSYLQSSEKVHEKQIREVHMYILCQNNYIAARSTLFFNLFPDICHVFYYAFMLSRISLQIIIQKIQTLPNEFS
jgi:hypothetical protein